MTCHRRSTAVALGMNVLMMTRRLLADRRQKEMLRGSKARVNRVFTPNPSSVVLDSFPPPLLPSSSLPSFLYSSLPHPPFLFPPFLHSSSSLPLSSIPPVLVTPVHLPTPPVDKSASSATALD